MTPTKILILLSLTAHAIAAPAYLNLRNSIAALEIRLAAKAGSR